MKLNLLILDGKTNNNYISISNHKKAGSEPAFEEIKINHQLFGI